jgi:hypothetical protein
MSDPARQGDHELVGLVDAGPPADLTDPQATRW